MPKSPLSAAQSRTVLLAVVLGVLLDVWVSRPFALGAFLTALWAVLGLRALEGILRNTAVPKGHPRNEIALLFWVAVKIGVYGIALWILYSRPFPALSHAVGFTLMMVVLVVEGARMRATRPPTRADRQDDDAQDHD